MNDLNSIDNNCEGKDLNPSSPKKFSTSSDQHVSSDHFKWLARNTDSSSFSSSFEDEEESKASTGQISDEDVFPASSLLSLVDKYHKDVKIPRGRGRPKKLNIKSGRGTCFGISKQIGFV